MRKYFRRAMVRYSNLKNFLLSFLPVKKLKWGSEPMLIKIGRNTPASEQPDPIHIWRDDGLGVKFVGWLCRPTVKQTSHEPESVVVVYSSAGQEMVDDILAKPPGKYDLPTSSRSKIAVTRGVPSKSNHELG